MNEHQLEGVIRTSQQRQWPKEDRAKIILEALLAHDRTNPRKQS